MMLPLSQSNSRKGREGNRNTVPSSFPTVNMAPAVAPRLNVSLPRPVFQSVNEVCTLSQFTNFLNSNLYT